MFWVAGAVDVVVQSILYPTRRFLYLRHETALPVAAQNSKQKAGLALAHCVFQKKKKHNSYCSRQRADKVVLLRLGFIRGKCKGSRIVTASRSGPQSEKSATR